MTSQQMAEDAVQVTLVAAGNHPGLAARVLVQHFGLHPDETEALLNKGRGVIATQVRTSVALHARPLLALLGLQICLTPMGMRVEPEVYDLSVRLADGACLPQVLAALRICAEVVHGDFAGPSGLVLRGLSQARVDACDRALQPVEGAQVTICRVLDARYDLFGPVDGGKALMAVRRHLALMGCQPDAMTSALATDLDQGALRHVLSRFADCGLMSVNQAFQRYDVTLTGSGHLDLAELRDFLTTRGHHAPHLARSLAAGQPLRIETGLARRVARQFLSDYRTIGIPARADLIRA